MTTTADPDDIRERMTSSTCCSTTTARWRACSTASTGTSGSERREGLFRQLTRTLVQHEEAEELTVYPFLRKLGDAGESQATARIEEQSAAEALLRSMERLDVMGEASRTASWSSVPPCGATPPPRRTWRSLTSGATSSEERARLADEYGRAKRRAPSHPAPPRSHHPTGQRGGRSVSPPSPITCETPSAVRTTPAEDRSTRPPIGRRGRTDARPLRIVMTPRRPRNPHRPTG